MTLRAPVAVELGWFLVSNSGSLPAAPGGGRSAPVPRRRSTWDRWPRGASAPTRHDFARPDVGDWDAQRDLTWIVGLLLRGWRKGLDAEAGVVLASGVVGRRRPRVVVRAGRGGGRPAPLSGHGPVRPARSAHSDEGGAPCPRPSRSLPGIAPSACRSARSSRPTGSCSSPARSATRPASHGAVPGGIEAETRAMLDNVGRLLDAAGLGFEDVVKATVYLRDFDEFAAMNAIYREYFPTEPPTRATVGRDRAGRATYRIEIEVTRGPLTRRPPATRLESTGDDELVDRDHRWPGVPTTTIVSVCLPADFQLAWKSVERGVERARGTGRRS